MRSCWVRFCGANVHDRGHKRNDPVQSCFFFTSSHIFEECNLSASTFNTSSNCGRICFLGAGSRVNKKRCEADTIENSSRLPQQLPHNTCPHSSQQKASTHAFSYCGTNACYSRVLTRHIHQPYCNWHLHLPFRHYVRHSAVRSMLRAFNRRLPKHTALHSCRQREVNIIFYSGSVIVVIF